MECFHKNNAMMLQNVCSLNKRERRHIILSTKKYTDDASALDELLYIDPNGKFFTFASFAVISCVQSFNTKHLKKTEIASLES